MKAHVYKVSVYLEIRKAIYGLPQAGILANKLLRKRLAPHGYYEVAHTPGLWCHVHCPIEFFLVVDDFGVKYVDRKHANHLLQTLHHCYKTTIDWSGSLYCGISLKWNYQQRYVNISMPGYIDKVQQRFNHPSPATPQNSPYQPQPRQFGTAAQRPIEDDVTPKIDEPRTKRIQQIIGMLLYYARAVDLTLLPALSAITSEQTTATETTEHRIKQLLDYVSTHPSATI